MVYKAMKLAKSEHYDAHYFRRVAALKWTVLTVVNRLRDDRYWIRRFLMLTARRY